MIKTAQRRFILITLSILFAVFSVIFGVIWGINRNNFSREVQMLLGDTEREYAENKELRPFRKTAVIELYDDGGVKITGGDNFDKGGSLTAADTFLFTGDTDRTAADTYLYKVRAGFCEEEKTVFIDDVSCAHFDFIAVGFTNEF